MVGYAVDTQDSKAAELEVAQAEAPEFEKVTWYTDPGLRKLYFWCSILCVASATTGYDGMLLNTSQNLTTWENYFGHPTGSKQDLLNAIYQIGSLISFPLVPYMADWWGRFLGAFSNGYGMYLGGRFILDFRNSLSQMSSPVLLTELCHPQHRGRFTAIYNCLWNLGAVFVAWLAWGTMQIQNDWAWRTLTLLQALPALIQVTFIYWVPESPRWLISKDRYEEAETIPLNGGQNILSLLVSVGCAFLVDRVGRRPLFLASTTGMVLMFLAWTIVSSQYRPAFLADGKTPNPNASNVKTTGYPQIVFVWMFGVFYSLAWSGLLVAYALEILPYKLRAKGLMIINLTVQAALVLGNYTNAIAWANLAPHDWTFCLFYTIWDFLELCFVYFFYIETRGPTLEELAKIFDGDSAEVAHLDMREVEKDIHLDSEPINEKGAVRTKESTV